MDSHLSRRAALKLSAAIGISVIAPRALAQQEEVDTLIAGAYVHTMNAGREFFRNGAVAIQGQRIVAVGPTDEIRRAFRARTVVEGGGKMVLPGFFDNHFHPVLTAPAAPLGYSDHGAAYPGAEGAFDKRSPGPFMPGGDFEANFRWLFPLCRYGFTDEESYYYALNALMIDAAAGVTCFVDGGAGQTRAIAQAQVDLGMRGNLCRTAYDLLIDPNDRSRGLQRVEDVDDLLLEADRLYKEIHGMGDGLVNFWCNFAHEVAASDELIKGMVELARKHATGLYSHSVTMLDESYSTKNFGRGALDRLEELGVLGPNWLGVHMGGVTQQDIPRLRKYDCKVVHAPGTTLFAGKGYISHSKIFPRLVDAGVAVSLGADTVNRGVVLVEAQRAFAAHKDAWQDSRVFPPYTVARMLTSVGARCALRPDCGSLEVGKRADLTIIDIDSPRYDGADPLAALLYVGYPSDVCATMVDGKFIYKDRQYPTVDAEQVTAQLRRINARRSVSAPKKPG